MSAFDLYAACYDLLYGDKDYRTETDYVAGLLPPGTRRLLELGGGTGGHAACFAERGIEVDAIDLSPQMIERAQQRRAALPAALQQRLRFSQGDVRSHRAGARFDAVLSLFHVMSYQTTNADLRAAFATARAHLEPGGLFVFDFWYGPAVLSDRPRHVVKEVADARVQVRRTTTPAVDVNANRVDVRFDVDIRATADGSARTVTELHPMRYLFLPEIDLLAADAGFERTAAHAWMTREAPDDRSWYAVVALRAT
jgi:SAM-dependent methyltransferase